MRVQRQVACLNYAPYGGNGKGPQPLTSVTPMPGVRSSMSHTLRFNHGLGVIVLRTNTVVDVKELRAAFDELVDLPGFKAGLCLVADLRGGETALSADDVRHLAQYAENTDAKWGNTKWLIIAATDLTYGLSRMFVTLAERHQVTTHVFRNVTDADGWLDLGTNVREILASTPE
jgi:hypothetical protein